jgi:hypothetical protein
MKKTIAVIIIILSLTLLLISSGCSENEPLEVVFVKAADSVDGYACIIKPHDRDLTILQLTDIHIEYFMSTTESLWTAQGICGNASSTLNMLGDLIDSVNPDLVVLTGDVERAFLNDNLAIYTRIAEVFETRDILWMPVFGNHDYEAEYSAYQHTDKELETELAKFPHCLIYDGGCQDGAGNYFVNVVDTYGEIIYTLCALDCVHGEEYDSGWSYLKTEAQVNWYETNIKAISSLRYGENSSEVIPSMVFTHTPVPQVATGWDTAWNGGSPTSDYHYGNLISGKNSIASYIPDDIFWNKVLTLNSTKAMFFGHHHSNDFCFDYMGVTLVSGQMSTNNLDYRIDSDYSGIIFKEFDFRDLIEYGDDRGGTKITINSNGSFTVSPVYAREVLSNYYTDYAPDYETIYSALEARGITVIR